ncbi:MAG: hypothetical protein HY260_14695 [Chloroflexi bacterium]|nr:hypothetical protein [Chloroflexota bacterium]
MKLSDLSPESLAKIRTYRYDRIIEKHEGPEDWDDVLQYYDPEFLSVNGYSVLLPLDREHHPNITILRCIPSADGQTLTIFLKDTTYVEDPQYETFWAGFVAVCGKVPGEEFFIAMLYHEWFIVDHG